MSQSFHGFCEEGWCKRWLFQTPSKPVFSSLKYLGSVGTYFSIYFHKATWKAFVYISCMRFLVLMEEILHHLGCIKLCRCDVYHISWWSPDFWTINSVFPVHQKNISVQIQFFAAKILTGLVHKDSSPLITGAEGIFIYSALPRWFHLWIKVWPSYTEKSRKIHSYHFSRPVGFRSHPVILV